MSQNRLKTWEKTVGDEARICINFADRLGSGETLSSVENVEVPSGITVTSGGVNGSTFTDKDGTTVAANEGVLLDVSGGTAETTYEVRVRAVNSNGNDKPEVVVPIFVTHK